MFNNIGRKIKTLSKAVAVVGIGISVIVGIITIVSAIISTVGAAASAVGVILGIFYTAIGCLVSWIGSFFTYGFGELIEKTTEIAEWCRKKQVTNNDIRQRDYLTRVTSQLKNEHPRNNN